MCVYEQLTNNRMFNRIVAVLFFILSAIVYFVVYKDFPPYLVNDSAVEVLQVIDFEPWPIQAFIPSYKLGLVVMIESFYGYWMQPFLWLLGNDIAVFKLALGLAFAFTGSLFFILSKRMFGLSVAILVTAAYITSAYTIWWPMLLLRNAFCPLITICILLGFLDLHEGKLRRGFLMVIISSFIAINTYSTFKVVVPAIFISAFLAGFFTYQNKAFIKRVSISGFALACLITIFFIYTGVTSELLFRGSYMFADTELSTHRNLTTYLTYVARSFLLPIYENPQGFLAEPTHLTFGRSMLNPLLYGAWCLGIGVVFFNIIKKETMAFICLASLIFSSLLLCVGGPSLKTHLALAPLEFLVIAYAFNFLLKTFNYKKIILSLLASYILVVGYLESQYMLTSVRALNVESPDGVGQDVGLYLAQHSKEFDFVIYGTYAVDSMRAFYPAYRFKTEVAPFYNTSDEASFYEVLERNLRQYNRVWLILTPDSPHYSKIKSGNVFCFEKTIAGRMTASVFVRCNKTPT